MGSTIPQLTMFPLYPGGPMVRNTGSLNASSSFYTQATRFTPAFGVNVPASSSAIPDNRYLAVEANGRLESRSVSQAGGFSRNLSFDGSVLGGLKQAAVPAVAPVIPDLYREMAALLSISDLKMADLMAQPSFRMPGIGLGLKVTTDGMGGVDTLEISPSSRGALPNVSPFAPTFGGPKMTEITTGATFKAIPDSGLGGNASPAIPARPNSAAVNALPGSVPAFSPNAPPRNAGIFNLNPLNGLPGLEVPGLDGPDSLELDGNAILQRLMAMQPPEQGLAVAGFDTSVTVAQARQIAVNQAGLDVKPSERFRENMAGLASSGKAMETYAAALNPRQMDGRIPMAPSLPQADTGQTGLNFGMGGGDGFNMGAAVGDAMNRRGSGGYIPFRMGGEGASSGGGSGNPFMAGGGVGGQAQERRQQRRPFAFMA